MACGKGNKERVVPMGPRLRRSLRRYLKHRDALVPAGVDSRLPPPHLCITDKGSRVTEWTLRRTFDTWYLQESPGQLIELAELMRHSNLAHVRKYALSDEERVRAGVANL